MISCTSIAAQRHVQVSKRRSRAEQVFKRRASAEQVFKRRSRAEQVFKWIITSIELGAVKVGKECLVMWLVETTVHALSEL